MQCNWFRKKTVEELLRGLSDYRFDHLVDELAFALAFHEIGELAAKESLGSGGRWNAFLKSGTVFHPHQRQSIIDSHFYAAVHQESIRRNLDQDRPDWLDWPHIGHQSGLRVRQALRTAFWAWYPVPGVKPSWEEINAGRKVISELGLSGIFVDWLRPYYGVNLEDVFRRAKL